MFEIEPAEFHYNPIGVVHGGLALALLDSAMGCAVHSTLPAGVAYTTLEVKANFVRPLTAATGLVRCAGTVVHGGRTVATAEGRIEDARRQALRPRHEHAPDPAAPEQGRPVTALRRIAASVDFTVRWSRSTSPTASKSRWQRAWEEEGLYAAGAGARREESYVICVPPPNVTGELHLGHALNGSIQDVLVRWHRMRATGRSGSPGYDHAGISTQNVVEKQLAREGLTRHDLGREAFVERTWEWLEQTGRTIMGQYRRLGASLDYCRERFTLDAGYSRAVTRFFVRLWERGGSIGRTGSSTGARSIRRRSRTSRSSTRTWTTRSPTSAIRSPTATAPRGS